MGVDILKNSQSRVFITEDGSRIDRNPAYTACMKAGGLSQDFGDITRIECPSPDRFGEFVEVAQSQGAIGRVSVTLTGRYALDVASTLLRMAKKRCSTTLHILFGKCRNPLELNKFEKTIIISDARYINYSTDDLGALGSDEEAGIGESADVSGSEIYELFQMEYAARGDAVITNNLIDVIYCDDPSCGDCVDQSDGCQKIYAVSVAAGGSVGTPPDIIYSVDGGTTFYAHDIDSALTGVSATAIACHGDYLIVTESAAKLHYVEKKLVTPTTDHTWTGVSTGFVTGKSGLAMDNVGTRTFIVGTGGYIYYTDDPTGGVVVADAGTIVSDNLLDVMALSSTFAIAVGNNGAIVRTDDGNIWTKVVPPVGVGINFNCVWVQSTTEWLLGTSNGKLYYTTDGGVSFREKLFNGSGAGQIDDLVFTTRELGFMAHQTTVPLRGRILRTIDGGASWFVEPEYGALPLADHINAIAACRWDPNRMVAVGLADNATDGILIIGSQ